MDLENNTLLIGLPATGKSSFLAALYNYVLSDIPDKQLTQYKLSDDAEYLNKIHETWLEYKVQQRTTFEKRYDHNVSMFIEDTSTEDKLKLNIPDLAGEVFQDHWRNRSMELEYKSLIEGASGMIFFISPLGLKPHLLLSQVKRNTTDFLEGLFDDKTTETNGYSESAAKWIHDEVPTQVRIVEILQIHLDKMNQINLIPIVFVVSAWDTQIKNSISPKKWIETNLPLLHQFLVSNSQRISHEVVGISAQGGDYENQENLTEIQNFSEPAERVKVTVDGDSYSTNIAYPIQWIIQKWKEIKGY